MMRPSVQGVDHPVWRLGCCCLHMQEIVPVDFRRAFCPLEGGGGGRHTGTRLTVSPAILKTSIQGP